MMRVPLAFPTPLPSWFPVLPWLCPSTTARELQAAREYNFVGTSAQSFTQPIAGEVMRAFRRSTGCAGALVIFLGAFGVSADGNRLAKRKAAATGISTFPVNAQVGISAALGRELPGYGVQVRGTGWEALNADQKITTDFTLQGVVVHAENAVWGITLSGYGCGDATKRVNESTPQASANRIEYSRGPLTEWYVNGPLGLEQGFTLTEPPWREELRTKDSRQRTIDHSPLTIALA